MSAQINSAAQSGEAIGALCERLRERRSELERATLARVYGIADPSSIDDPDYRSGLRAAVGAGLDYGLSAISAGGGSSTRIPLELLAQARQAARNRVSLDIVLRRYFAGYAVLGDFIVGGIGESSGLGGAEVRRVLRTEASLFDRLIVAIADEYARESSGRRSGVGERRADQVRRLLAGDFVEGIELGYGLDAWHLGMVASGPGVAEVLRGLAGSLDRRLLLVRVEDETIWAWLGGGSPVFATDIVSISSSRLPPGVSVAVGEPASGLAGWRATHLQAKAALPIALRDEYSLIRYADVSLLVSALKDDVLVASLASLYLEPLVCGREGGEDLRRTARAYFASGGNVSAAAAALGLSRPTVTSRLQAIEEKIGRPLGDCTAEMETALRLQELGYVTSPANR